MGIYDDIFDLPQFLPFAALTGFDAAIRETTRLSEERAELGENRYDP